MASKVKRQKARAIQQMNKRRAKYKRIMAKYKLPGATYTVGGNNEDFMVMAPPSSFDLMMEELTKLNVKHCQQLLNDLKAQGAISPWYGDYHRSLILKLEFSIIERTVLK